MTKTRHWLRVATNRELHGIICSILPDPNIEIATRCVWVCVCVNRNKNTNIEQDVVWIEWPIVNDRSYLTSIEIESIFVRMRVWNCETFPDFFFVSFQRNRPRSKILYKKQFDSKLNSLVARILGLLCGSVRIAALRLFGFWSILISFHCKNFIVSIVICVALT